MERNVRLWVVAVLVGVMHSNNLLWSSCTSLLFFVSGRIKKVMGKVRVSKFGRGVLL